MSNYQDLFTREMLGKIRSSINEGKKRANLLSEGYMDRRNKRENEKEFPITEKTPQFGGVRKSQEDTLRKTIGDSIDFDENALIYYPNDKFIVLNGMLTSKNLAFQFKFPDSNGDGCYIWSDGIQLSDENSRILGKLRDGFINWRKALVDNGDLMKKIHQAATKNDDDES